MFSLRRFALLILATATAGGVVSGCKPKAPPAPPPPTVVVATPLQQTVIDWDDYVGQFTAVDSVDVRPRVSGYLQSVGFKDGANVAKGQILFEIDPRPYQAALDQAKGQAAHAQATLTNAQAEEARGQSLLTAHAISQQAYDVLVAAKGQAAADLVSAQAQVQSAQLNLEFTKVTAPMSGRVSDRRIAPGNLVTADTTVLTNIVNLNPIRFAFSGSEALYLKQQRQNARGEPLPVEIRLQDEPDYRWKGHLEFIDNSLDAGSGTIRGRAVVDNPSNFLTPGLFGHMRLRGTAAYAALLVPDQAVTTNQTRQIVYVLDANNVVHERGVTPGALSNGLRVIRAGLNPGDRVIIDGVQRARPGRPVNPTNGQVKPLPPAPDSGQPGQDLSAPASTATFADAAQ